VNGKTVAAVVLAVLAVAIGTYIYFMQPQGEEADLWAGKEEAYMEDFADNLASSSEMYVVMDLRGASENSIRRNIMQCAVDISYSTAIGNIDKRIFSLDSECITTLEDGTAKTVPLSECLSEIGSARDAPGKSIVYIRKYNETRIFENELVVGIGENYVQFDCNIGARPAGPSFPAIPPALNTSVEQNGTGADVPENPEEGEEAQ